MCLEQISGIAENIHFVRSFHSCSFWLIPPADLWADLADGFQLEIHSKRDFSQKLVKVPQM